jgi:hypothetical protein
MRDRKFYINSIKMDLFRIVTATGDVTKPAAVESAREFLKHALKDFDKFENVSHDITIKNELQRNINEIYKLQETAHRLRWVENILTLRCRLY